MVLFKDHRLVRGGLLEPVGVAVLGGQSVPDFGNGLAGRASFLLDIKALVGMTLVHGVANERSGSDVRHKGHSCTADEEDGGQGHRKNGETDFHRNSLVQVEWDGRI